MAKEHDFATRQLAQEFYVVDGMTYEQVAAQTNVSVPAIKEWSAAEKWREKRLQYRQDLQDIKANTVKLRKALLEKSLLSLDPQDVYAVSRLESLASRQAIGNRQEATDESAPSTSSGPAREIKTAEEAVTALDEALAMRVNTMLSQPGAINLGAIRDLKKALELLQQMKKAAGTEAAGTEAKIITPELLQRIKEEVYGI
jgi:hypothetical protein